MDRLVNEVRAYAWGSTTAIPELLGVPATGEPWAELWMGAHPSAPSLVDRGAGPQSLAALIAADPAAELGPEIAERFGARLPFLLKVLAPEQPLSLQVHPDTAQAVAGFAAEDALGIPLDASFRNYKDRCHKPEMVCALGEFGVLCGFRPIPATLRLLDLLDLPCLKDWREALRARPDEAGLREAATGVFSVPADQRTAVVAEVAAACARVAGTDSEFAAACTVVAGLADRYPADLGVVAALLLNHLILQPGEAMFLHAGVPHAYLHGVAVEIMANSDNVLRCGLTDKHVDVPELLRVMAFDSDPVRVLTPRPEDGEDVYHAPIAEFRLSTGTLGPAPHPLDTAAPQILWCAEGTARVAADDEVVLKQGDALYIREGASRPVVTGSGRLFRATVPCTTNSGNAGTAVE